tara:strand:+ start:625 stop:1224 length:600 start_codon:yes stop_codon:yes gene_type:complete
MAIYAQGMDDDLNSAARVAGHAVVGEVMGFACEGLTIRWTDQKLGVCRWPPMPEAVFAQLQFERYRPTDPEFMEIKDWVVRRIKAYLGGAVAESQISGVVDLPWLTTDLNMISVVTRNVFGQPGPDFDELLTSEIFYDIDLGLEVEDLSRVVYRARQLWEHEIQLVLAEEATWLSRITDLLQERHTLSGHETRSLRPVS